MNIIFGSHDDRHIYFDNDPYDGSYDNILIGSGIDSGNGSYDDPNIEFDDDPFIGSYIDPYDG